MGRARIAENDRLSADVLGLAWPVMLSMGLGTLLTLMNAFWIGRLGPVALAVVAPAQFASWILWTLGAVLSTGVPALVARAIGAGERERAAQVAAAAVQLSVVLGLVLALPASLLSGAVFQFVTLDPNAEAMGRAYLDILLLGSATFFAFLAFEAAIRAAGDTRTPMRFSVLMLLLNFGLDPLLILGPGPFPRWEVAGAAIATVIAQTIALVAFIVYLQRGKGRLRIRFRELRRPNPENWARIVRIGVPGGLNAGLFTAVYVFLSVVVARFGSVPLAVLGVGNRLESINYLIASGFEVAASALVGRSLGAGDTVRAERAAWRATLFSAIFTGVVGTGFFLFAGPLMAAFSSDAATIAEGRRFLRIIAPCQLWMGVEIAIFGGFVGAGNTVPPAAISATISLLRIPLSYGAAVTLGGGSSAVWWVLSLTCMARGALLAAWFRNGGWKRARVG